jgi:hypothetical protein
MFKGTTLTKSLTTVQMDFLKQLDEEEIQLFTLETVREITGDRRLNLSRAAITDIVQKQY